MISSVSKKYRFPIFAETSKPCLKMAVVDDISSFMLTQKLLEHKNTHFTIRGTEIKSRGMNDKIPLCLNLFELISFS
ncbi:hypothetical protein MIDIC_490036 [Alphaproteobacteria bacterium]